MAGVAVGPDKAHAPLVVDADAVLPLSVAQQRLQAVARRNAQVVQRRSPIQHGQLAQGSGFDVGPALDPHAVEQALGVGTLEIEDHAEIVTTRDSIVNRFYRKIRAPASIKEDYR